MKHYKLKTKHYYKHYWIFIYINYRTTTTTRPLTAKNNNRTNGNTANNINGNNGGRTKVAENNRKNAKISKSSKGKKIEFSLWQFQLRLKENQISVWTDGPIE